MSVRRRREADIERRLDATEHLRREMHEMRTLIETLVPQPGAASTSQGAPVASTRQSGLAAIATWAEMTNVQRLCQGLRQTGQLKELV